MAFIPAGLAVIGTALGASAGSAALVGGMAVATVASGAMSAVGAIQQGEAQSNAQKAQADVNRYNAIVARNNAESANQQASAKEDLQRRHFAQVQGEAKAAIAQSNTGFLGTNDDLLRQNAINAELDALNIRYEGQQRASGLMAQSQIDDFNASQNRINASNASTAGYMGAGANLLSTAGTVAYYGSGLSKTR